MFDAHQFYKKRLSEHLKETSRYLKYVFNGHLAVALLFLISALAFYYQQWLLQLPENFPTALVIGISFGLVVTYSPIQTFLQEPDLVFLCPAEKQMGPYFRNAIIYNFIIQLYHVILMGAALGPLYFHTFFAREGKIYLYTLMIVIMFKAWNLIANWWILRVRNNRSRKSELIFRFFLNVSIFYFIVSAQLGFATLMTIGFMILFLNNYRMAQKQDGIAWDVLVERDISSRQTFYRIANLFTDVPHIKNPIRKRKWLTWLIARVPFMQKYTYTYLYRFSFVRSGDYLGMYIRLLFIGGLVLYMISHLWMQILFVLLFLYLSSFQMMALYKHHRTIVWIDLYPVRERLRAESVIRLLFYLSLVKTCLFSVIFLWQQDYNGFILALFSGLVFTFGFTKGYVRKKIYAMF